MLGSNSGWYHKYLAGLQMAEGTRGWQSLELYPSLEGMATSHEYFHMLQPAVRVGKHRHPAGATGYWLPETGWQLELQRG